MRAQNASLRCVHIHLNKAHLPATSWTQYLLQLLVKRAPNHETGHEHENRVYILSSLVEYAHNVCSTGRRSGQRRDNNHDLPGQRSR
jgi:hypothetical protein